VHGFLCNRGFWNPWMLKLRHADVPFIALNLEPPFASIDAHRASIGGAIRRLEAATGRAPVIVAHSMGGLAVRAWLASRNPGDTVHRIITIGTPHAGTWLARFAGTVNGTEMRQASSWLKRLSTRERESDRERFVCFYGRCDNIVFPSASATLPGADNRHLASTAHVQMAFHADVISTVLDCAGVGPKVGPPIESRPY
jgi:triacylglycerol lipase